MFWLRNNIILMKTAPNNLRPHHADNVLSKSLSTRILHSAVVLLAIVVLAVVATIAVYWSLNNGTLTKFIL